MAKKPRDSRAGVSDRRTAGPEAPPAMRPEGVTDDHILRVFRAPPEFTGMRLDRFLMTQLRATSRTRAQVIIRNSAFALDGRRLRPSKRIDGEEWIALWRPPLDEDDTRLPIGILHEDPHLLVVDKPAPMTVHPTARHHTQTLIKRLEAERPDEFLTLIHRLDRDTSGILLLARSQEADRRFKRLLEDRSVAVMAVQGDRVKDKGLRASARRGLGLRLRKTYLAIAKGDVTPTLIDVPLEPDSDNPLRVKMRIARAGQGLEARTEVAVLDRCDGYSLVACELHTGRQHQIRLHLAHAGTPIVGDKLYGPDERLLARAADGELTDDDEALLELPRQALHAHRYVLPHAITGEALDLVAPLPSDLAAFWESMAGRPAPAELTASPPATAADDPVGAGPL